MNGEKTLITTPSSTKSEPSDGMTSESRSKNLIQETRYFSLTLVLSFFGRGKLRSKWDGPYSVLASSSHGAVTLQDEEGNVFKANGQRLKIYLEPKMPQLEELDALELIEVT
jgi:hypothetical protein